MALGLTEAQAQVALQTAGGDLKKAKAALLGESGSSSDSDDEDKGDSKRNASLGDSSGTPLDKDAAVQELISVAGLTKTQAEAALKAANNDVKSALAAFAESDSDSDSD